MTSGKSKLEKNVEDAMDDAEETVSKAAKKVADKIDDGIESAADAIEKSKDKALDAAESVVKKTSRAINGGLDDAERTIRSKRRGSSDASSSIDGLACKAIDLAEESIHFVADASERTCQQVADLSAATRSYIRQKPEKSMLIAAGVGALLTALLVGRRGR